MLQKSNSKVYFVIIIRHEMVRVTENSFDPPSINSRGFVNYLLDGVKFRTIFLIYD